MLHALAPGNWIDWSILVLAGSGCVSGLRRTWVRGAATALGLLAAAVVAGHLAPRVVALADARWHVQTQLTAFGVRVAPLPDGIGATPYSPTAAALIGAQIASVTTPAYARAVQGLLGRGLPVGGQTQPTVDGHLAAAGAAILMRLVAFGAILAALRLAVLLLAALVRAPQGRSPAGRLTNTIAAAAIGTLEGLAFAALLLAGAETLSSLPPFSGLSASVAASRWAPLLLPAAAHVISWLG